ncbi:hypothetical protein [Gordonia sihwensis]|uniref:hypothetical protein n=1 Tax=Gordonia sihwensis TaxID=173559 RepID=UPI001C92D17B|nr:hypothetical protein [Gordonia sihwensis]WFN91460.1 hypothetical protein P5P27_11775 [Gordonia sihwensis]
MAEQTAESGIHPAASRESQQVNDTSRNKQKILTITSGQGFESLCAHSPPDAR